MDIFALLALSFAVFDFFMAAVHFLLLYLNTTSYLLYLNYLLIDSTKHYFNFNAVV